MQTPEATPSRKPHIVPLVGGFAGLGATVEFFGRTFTAEDAFPLYTVEDALRLRTHIVSRWEAADRDPSTWSGFTHQRSGRILAGEKES